MLAECMVNEYHKLEDFDKKRRKTLESLLYSDEQFLYGIDVYDAILFTKRRASKLVLTDRRVIEFKRGFIRENSKDYSLDDIASIEHKKGYIRRKISLQGSGFSEQFQTLEDFGREFVTAARQQMHRNEEGLDPLSPLEVGQSSKGVSADDSTLDDPTVDDPLSGSESPPDGSAASKFGSIKWHAIIAVLTIWWTFGIGNAGYAGYKYYKYQQEHS